jgi:hypothetical protein
VVATEAVDDVDEYVHSRCKRFEEV